MPHPLTDPAARSSAPAPLSEDARERLREGAWAFCFADFVQDKEPCDPHTDELEAAGLLSRDVAFPHSPQYALTPLGAAAVLLLLTTPEGEAPPGYGPRALDRVRDVLADAAALLRVRPRSMSCHWIAAAANAAAAAAPGPALPDPQVPGYLPPVLSKDSSRDDVAAWLAWNDADGRDFDTLAEADAWALLERLLTEAGSGPAKAGA